MDGPTSSGLLAILSALANPHRLQILAVLADETNYVSSLAREIGISRPLLIMHLKRLEAVGLVTSRLVTNKCMCFRLPLLYMLKIFDLKSKEFRQEDVEKGERNGFFGNRVVFPFYCSAGGIVLLSNENRLSD